MWDLVLNTSTGIPSAIVVRAWGERTAVSSSDLTRSGALSVKSSSLGAMRVTAWATCAFVLLLLAKSTAEHGLDRESSHMKNCYTWYLGDTAVRDDIPVDVHPIW